MRVSIQQATLNFRVRDADYLHHSNQRRGVALSAIGGVILEWLALFTSRYVVDCFYRSFPTAIFRLSHSFFIHSKCAGSMVCQA